MDEYPEISEREIELEARGYMEHLRRQCVGGGDFRRLLEKHPRPWKVTGVTAVILADSKGGWIAGPFHGPTPILWSGIVEAVNGYTQAVVTPDEIATMRKAAADSPYWRPWIARLFPAAGT